MGIILNMGIIFFRNLSTTEDIHLDFLYVNMRVHILEIHCMQ